MPGRAARNVVAAALWLTCLAGCGGSDTTPGGSTPDTSLPPDRGEGGQGGRAPASTDPRPRLGLICSSDADCMGAGLSCHDGDSFCTRPCTVDRDCGTGLCSTTTFGDPACMPPCSSLPSPADYVCTTESACGGPDADCERCGCPSGQMCNIGRCVTPAAVGEACLVDDDCLSGNCSEVARVCRVAIGDFCDATNCDYCRVYQDWSSCSRRCYGPGTCGPGNDCRGFEPNFYCYELCSPRGCPSACDEICECPECEIVEPLRTAGQPCEYDAQCASEGCFGSPFGNGRFGVCADACAMDGTCDDGFGCKDGRCLPSCTPGTACEVDLHSLATTTCSAQGVCDPRGSNGQACVSDEECLSAHCMEGTCRGAAVIGGACASDGDCAEGICCSGICRTAC